MLGPEYMAQVQIGFDSYSDSYSDDTLEFRVCSTGIAENLIPSR